ncbi:MAG: hypothetical protein EU531_01135 [Promethearchaeota archaeon]|nr:MAG: hypothetical protein EU531_01135 [Candidatus Lokiarchaeota archaeon]
MEISPKVLYKNFINKIIDAESLIEQLSSLIENSRNIKIRVLSIQTLGKIELNSLIPVKSQNSLFHLLENLLISDSNEIIRNEAALILIKLFKKRSLAPMKWALLHDESAICLETIHQSIMEIINDLKKSNEDESYSTLKSEVLAIEDKDFKIAIQNMIHRNDSIISKTTLIHILTNYFTLLFLKKVYWRLKYRIKDATLVELDFSFKVLSNLPRAIRFLQSLKKLTLKYNQILKLPEWIGELSSLEHLNLNINNIAKLPNSVSMLNQLEELALWKNELEELPESIGNLINLRKLNLRLNQLKFLPESLGNLIKLKELDLHDNRLLFLPRSIKYMKSLEVLNLSWNTLKNLPEEIYDLSSLKILDLGRNELQTISPSVSRLNSLEILNLSENKLISLPHTIGNLSSLKILNLSRNQLKVIPNSIYSLPLLEELYLVDNQIEEIPSNIQELENRGLKIIS